MREDRQLREATSSTLKATLDRALSCLACQGPEQERSQAFRGFTQDSAESEQTHATDTLVDQDEPTKGKEPESVLQCPAVSVAIHQYTV